MNNGSLLVPPYDLIPLHHEAAQRLEFLVWQASHLKPGTWALVGQPVKDAETGKWLLKVTVFAPPWSHRMQKLCQARKEAWERQLNKEKKNT